MQEQDYVSVERVRDRLAENYFKPDPANLIDPPHEQPGRHERPEKPGVSSAVDRISGGENERRGADQTTE